MSIAKLKLKPYSIRFDGILIFIFYFGSKKIELYYIQVLNNSNQDRNLILTQGMSRLNHRKEDKRQLLT